MWRISHPHREAIWLWVMSVVCEVSFALSWLLDQLPKICPVNRVTDLSVLKDIDDSSNLTKGLPDLPGIDIVNTDTNETSALKSFGNWAIPPPHFSLIHIVNTLAEKVTSNTTLSVTGVNTMH